MTLRRLLALCAATGVVMTAGAHGRELSGTDLDDEVQGTSRPDVIRGYAGDDRLYGGDGDDLVVGGPGDDRIGGGDGADRLSGGDGNDVMAGDGGGRDRLSGGQGDDTLYGDSGPYPGGVTSPASFDGGPGADVLDLGQGPNRVRAGDGPDRIVAANGARDQIDCGSDEDLAIADRDDRVENCERVAVRRSVYPRVVPRVGTRATSFTINYSLDSDELCCDLVVEIAGPSGACSGSAQYGYDERVRITPREIIGRRTWCPGRYEVYSTVYEGDAFAETTTWLGVGSFTVRRAAKSAAAAR